MTIDTLGTLILGWLFVLLSPVIGHAIQKRYREKEIRQSIIAEFSELRPRIATAAYKCESRFGTYDRTLDDWLISILEKHKGRTEIDSCLSNLKEVAALDDPAFLEHAKRQKARPYEGLGVKKYRVPYLDSNIGELGIFDERSRSAILEVRAQLEMFNEEIDEARLYQKMTFDLRDSEINHPIACQLAQNSYKSLGQRAKQIADRIEPILAG